MLGSTAQQILFVLADAWYALPYVQVTIEKFRMRDTVRVHNCTSPSITKNLLLYLMTTLLAHLSRVYKAVQDGWHFD
jgi:hypothetical protein